MTIKTILYTCLASLLFITVAHAAGRPQLDVSGIEGKEPLAIVNDNIVKQGDTVSGAQVVQITSDGVNFKFQDDVFFEKIKGASIAKKASNINTDKMKKEVADFWEDLKKKAGSLAKGTAVPSAVSGGAPNGAISINGAAALKSFARAEEETYPLRAVSLYNKAIEDAQKALTGNVSDGERAQLMNIVTQSRKKLSAQSDKIEDARRSGQLMVNMSKDDVITCWGNPEQTEFQDVAQKMEIWFYPTGYMDRYGKEKYNRVYITNGRVTSFTSFESKK